MKNNGKNVEKLFLELFGKGVLNYFIFREDKIVRSKADVFPDRAMKFISACKIYGVVIKSGKFYDSEIDRLSDVTAEITLERPAMFYTDDKELLFHVQKYIADQMGVSKVIIKLRKSDVFENLTSGIIGADAYDISRNEGNVIESYVA